MLCLVRARYWVSYIFLIEILRRFELIIYYENTVNLINIFILSIEGINFIGYFTLIFQLLIFKWRWFYVTSCIIIIIWFNLSYFLINGWFGYLDFLKRILIYIFYFLKGRSIIFKIFLDRCLFILIEGQKNLISSKDSFDEEDIYQSSVDFYIQLTIEPVRFVINIFYNSWHQDSSDGEEEEEEIIFDNLVLKKEENIFKKPNACFLFKQTLDNLFFPTCSLEFDEELNNNNNDEFVGFLIFLFVFLYFFKHIFLI